MGVEMVLPGTYAILCPVMIGLLVGPGCLAGVLAGAIASGCMLGIMMSNAGGAWDNSKKYIEIECTPEEGTASYAADGETPSYAIKGNGFPTIPKATVHHDACVVGDTVGDPFKDTSGPALNILIKLMSMVSLTMAPLVENNGDWENWMYGMAPTAIFVVASVILSPLVMDIVGWSDPLKDLIQGSQSTEEKRNSAVSLSTDATQEAKP